MSAQKFFKGQVWIVKFKDEGDMSNTVISKTRPCLIMSNDTINKASRAVVVIPLSSSAHCNDGMNESVKFANHKDSLVYAVTNQIKTVSEEMMERYIYTLSSDVVRDIEIVLCQTLAILPVAEYSTTNVAANVPRSMILPKRRRIVSTTATQIVAQAVTIPATTPAIQPMSAEDIKKLRNKTATQHTPTTQIVAQTVTQLATTPDKIVHYDIDNGINNALANSDLMFASKVMSWTDDNKIQFILDCEKLLVSEVKLKYSIFSELTVIKYKNKFIKESKDAKQHLSTFTRQPVAIERHLPGESWTDANKMVFLQDYKDMTIADLIELYKLSSKVSLDNYKNKFCKDLNIANIPTNKSKNLRDRSKYSTEFKIKCVRDLELYGLSFVTDTYGASASAVYKWKSQLESKMDSQLG